jgi:hypothetical protein
MPAAGGHAHGSAPPAPAAGGSMASMPGMSGGEKPAAAGGMAGMSHGGEGKPGAESAPKGSMSTILGLLKNKPMDPNGIGLVKRLSTGFCKDCTVLSGKVDVVFTNGTVAGISNGVYLHHAVTVSCYFSANGVD